MIMVDFDKIKEQYDDSINNYITMGKNLEKELEKILIDNKIDFLSINSREKKYKAFIEKIDSKKYTCPFNQMTDICGVRVICYYLSDMEKISKLIDKEFDVLDAQYMKDRLKTDQFGYLSNQFVIKIKKEWQKVPQWRHFGGLKAEIQVRTVLMHAWGEIEHKLRYKKKGHWPDELERELFRLMALFEIASVNRTVIKDALIAKFSDFEDSIIYQAAHHAGADAIVSRDSKGFKQSTIPVYSPAELLNILQMHLPPTTYSGEEI